MANISLSTTHALWQSIQREYQRDLYTVQSEDTSCDRITKTVANFCKRRMVFLAGVVAIFVTPFFLAFDLICSCCIDNGLQEESSSLENRRIISSENVPQGTSVQRNTQEIFFAFYRNQAPNLHGVTIEQIWDYSPQQLESSHNYIQWLFPTSRQSAFNPSAPIAMTDWGDAFFHNPELTTNLERSFQTMLVFWGFYIINPPGVSDPRIRRENSFDFHARWLSSGNHNLLRMDRVINSLCILRRGDLAKAFYRALEDLYIEMPTSRVMIHDSLVNHWRPSILRYFPEMQNEFRALPPPPNLAGRVQIQTINLTDTLMRDIQTRVRIALLNNPPPLNLQTLETLQDIPS